MGVQGTLMMCRMVRVESVHPTLFSFLPIGSGHGNHTTELHSITLTLEFYTQLSVLYPGGNCSNK